MIRSKSNLDTNADHLMDYSNDYVEKQRPPQLTKKLSKSKPRMAVPEVVRPEVTIQDQKPGFN